MNIKFRIFNHTTNQKINLVFIILIPAYINLYLKKNVYKFSFHTFHKNKMSELFLFVYIFCHNSKNTYGNLAEIVFLMERLII